MPALVFGYFYERHGRTLAAPIGLHAGYNAVWLVLRLLSGVAVAGLFVASESWINQVARSEQRAQVMAIYNISLSAGFALGPLLGFVGVQGWAPFIIGAAIMFVAAIPMIFVPVVAPQRAQFGPVSACPRTIVLWRGFQPATPRRVRRRPRLPQLCCWPRRASSSRRHPPGARAGAALGAGARW